MMSLADEAAQDEKLILRFEKAVMEQTEKSKQARAVACPVCGAKPQSQCGYIATDEKFGEDLPLMYVHGGRNSAFQEREAQALKAML